METNDTLFVTVIDKENEVEHIIAFQEEKELAFFLLHYDKDKYEIIEMQKMIGKLSTSPKSFFIKQEDDFEHGQKNKTEEF